MAAIHAAEHAETLEDIVGHLERTSASKKASSELRVLKGPRVPQPEHQWRPTWKAPVHKDTIRQNLNADTRPEFARFVKNAGIPFHDVPGAQGVRLKPKALDPWTASRVVTPDRTFKKAYSQIKYHAHSEPFLEPHDGMCHRIHAEWLQDHRVRRDKHIYEVYHALNKVKAAEDQHQAHAQKRQLTRDLLTRGGGLDMPEFSDKVKASLGRVKKAVAASRTFHVAAKIDRLEEEEAKDKAAIDRAKSAPILRVGPVHPEGRATHLRKWQGPDVPLRYMRTDTPLRAQDEERELKMRELAMTG